MQAIMEKSTSSFRSLETEEERILEMYSRGESYEVIQENLLLEYGMDYSEKKLGHKMGQIKKAMKCQTQFQMGYLFGRREMHHQLLEERYSMKKSLMDERNRGFRQGRDTMKLALQGYSTAKDFNKGLHAGMIGASLFWLILFGILSNYIF